MPSPSLPRHPRARSVRPAAAMLAAVALLMPLAAPAAEIHTAARAGDLAAVRSLLDADADLVGAADERDCTPLHFAADAGQVAVLSLLLERGADLEAADADGDTPLHWAATAGQVEAIGALLDRGAAIDARNHQLFTPLLYAVRSHRHAAAQLLIDRGADLELPNDYGRTPLLWVAREEGDLELARLLLRAGAEVNALDRFDDSPLCLAAWRGFTTLVDMLLDAGARTDLCEGMDRQLLGFATERGLERLYGILVAGGTEIDVAPGQYGSILHVAANSRAPAIVADLLGRGAPVDAADMYGWTPLHHAASRRRPGVVRVLLEGGASPDRRSLSGWTPLGLAEMRGADEVAALLVARGAERSPRRFPVLSGPFLGQGEPPAEPQPFAPDVVATCHGEHGSISFSPDGREAFWSGHTAIPDSGYTYGTILTSRVVDGRWTVPRRAAFAGERQGDDVPFFAPDGRRVFFISCRPLAGDEDRVKENVWLVEREGDGWGEPRPLPPAVNALHQHWQISVAAGGDLYFASRTGGPETRGIYVSRLVDGEYGSPEFLGFAGHTPFIAPDESYLITALFDQEGLQTLLRFRLPDGSWSEPVRVADTHPGLGGMCPKVSPDGRAFFWIDQRTGANNHFWVDAGFIEELRRQHADS